MVTADMAFDPGFSEKNDAAAQAVRDLEDQQIDLRLRRTLHAIERVTSGVAQGLNLRAGQRCALAAIFFHPGISQNEMSRLVGLDKSVAVQILDDLENRGLAMRKPSNVDRRRHALFLTDEGRALFERVTEETEPIRANYLRLVEPDELRLLNDVLERICRALHDNGEGFA